MNHDTASFKIEISKVQDFGNLELSPMWLLVMDSLPLTRSTAAQLVCSNLGMKGC